VATLDYPLERLIDYAQHWQAQDFVRAAATRTPGRAIRNEDMMPRADYCQTDIYRRYSAPAGIEHALGIVEVDPISRVGEMLFLFRSDAGQFYSERDCRRLERLLPHFTTAWRHRQLLHALETSRAGEDDAVEPMVAHAVVDGSGQIHAAEPGFGQLLRDAFPDWTGPLLPVALAATLAGSAPFVDLGRLRITIRRRDRIVLGISRRDDEPALTAAEWRVAQAYARGHSAPRLAADFGVSPRTVRNQLAALYRKLDVHDRLGLIARLRQFGVAID
jgi:DNA-binding CsgD family transcriptional regulator